MAATAEEGGAEWLCVRATHMKNILEHREGERRRERWSKGSAKSKIFSASTHANCCQMGGLGMEEWERESEREVCAKCKRKFMHM